MSTDTHNNIAELYNKGSEMLEEYQSYLNKGEVVDISGFETIVRDMCSCIASLPAEEALVYKSKLQEISEKLEALSRSMEKQKDIVEGQLQNLDLQQKAATAYTQPKSN